MSNHPGIQCHFYAENTLIYLSFSPEFASAAYSWMISKKLFINPNKTEYLPFNPKNLTVNIINLGSNTISPSDNAKHLGVIFQTYYVHG